MLAKTRDLDLRDSEAAGFLENAEPFICVLARLYCRRLFEAVRFGLRQEYVGRVCQDVLEPKGLDVDLQEAGSVHLAEEAATKRRAFLLKPDILVRKGRSPRVVADTKWKRLDPRSADLGVSGEDVYQVLAYAHRYATDSAVLIYPHHAAVGRPGRQRDFGIHAGGTSRVVVRVVTLDLARLGSVPGEVGRAFRAC